MFDPPMVTSSVGPRLGWREGFEWPEEPNWEETLRASGRRVGRQAQITPQATSTTHQVQAVARVTSGNESVVWIFERRKRPEGREEEEEEPGGGGV